MYYLGSLLALSVLGVVVLGIVVLVIWAELIELRGFKALILTKVNYLMNRKNNE